MGTISEKLVYLNGTKQAIKQAINEDFEVIDNNSTFREYADEISSNNAKYKDLIPKETKNATNTLDISNSAGLDKALVTQYGNTYQDGEPTPDAPQEIQVVTGDNTINICGKNLFNKNGDIIYNKYIDASGNIVNETGNYYTNYYISINENNSYYISSNTNNSKRIAYYDSSKTFISRQLLNSTGGALTIPSNSKYVRISGFTNDMNIQLEKSNQATTYEPYQSQTYEVDLPVENLFDKDNANVLNGNLVSSSSITSSVSNRIFYINCQPNTTYTVQKAVGNYFVLGTTSSTPTIGGSYSQKTMDNTATKISITTDANAKYLICWYWNNGDTLTEEQTKATIQVELGTKANHYTEYGTTPIELCKIGDYKDKIYSLNGKWYLEKKINKVVLNGSENWAKGASRPFYTLLINDILRLQSAGNNATLFCNYLSPSTPATIWGNNINGITNLDDGNAIRIRIQDNPYTITTFKEWLNDVKPVVYYVLATPTTEEITESNYPTLYNQLNNIKLFEGVNHINMTNESGLDVEFDITYYKDWKLD